MRNSLMILKYRQDQGHRHSSSEFWKLTFLTPRWSVKPCWVSLLVDVTVSDWWILIDIEFEIACACFSSIFDAHSRYRGGIEHRDILDGIVIVAQVSRSTTLLTVNRPARCSKNVSFQMIRMSMTLAIFQGHYTVAHQISRKRCVIRQLAMAIPRYAYCSFAR